MYKDLFTQKTRRNRSVSKKIELIKTSWQVWVIGSRDAEVHEIMEKLFPNNQLMYSSVDSVFSKIEFYSKYLSELLDQDIVVLCLASDVPEAKVDEYLRTLIDSPIDAKIIPVLYKGIELKSTNEDLAQKGIFPMYYEGGFLQLQEEQQQLLELVKKCLSKEVVSCTRREFAEGLLVESRIGYLNPGGGERVQVVTQLDAEGELRGWIVSPEESLHLGKRFKIEIMKEKPSVVEGHPHPLTKERVKIEFFEAKVVKD